MKRTQAQIEAKRRRHKAYRERHPDRWKAITRKATHKYYITHTSKCKELAYSRALLLKLETLNHYGNGSIKCAICKESRLDCLSIDHLGGGGNVHRERMGTGGGGGKFYRWLRGNGYPDGYRVLCMNCQFIEYIQRLRERRLNNE